MGNGSRRGKKSCVPLTFVSRLTGKMKKGTTIQKTKNFKTGLKGQKRKTRRALKKKTHPISGHN